MISRTYLGISGRRDWAPGREKSVLFLLHSLTSGHLVPLCAACCSGSVPASDAEECLLVVTCGVAASSRRWGFTRESRNERDSVLCIGENSRCYFSQGSVSISRPRHMTVTESKKGISIGTRGGVQREARDFILKFLRMSWTWVFFFFLFAWKQRSEKWNSEGQRGHNPSVFKPCDPPGNLTPTGTEVRAASGVLAETLLEKHSVHENQE